MGNKLKTIKLKNFQINIRAFKYLQEIDENPSVIHGTTIALIKSSML